MLAGGDEDLRVLDRLARLEAMQKDGQAVLARQHSHQLVIWGDRHDTRGHGQVQGRRLIVIVALMGDNLAGEQDLRSDEKCDDDVQQSRHDASAVRLRARP